MINNKDQIIKYFEDGIKEERNLKIGVEHEKFIFNKKNNKRIDYSKIKKMFSSLLEFGWNPICLLYTSPSPRDLSTSRMPSSA